MLAIRQFPTTLSVMKRIPLVFRLALASTLLMQVAGAGLKFDSTHVKIQAKPAQEELPVTFKFVAEGEKSVQITKVETTCGCLKAKADKATYKSGEKGVIDSVFSVGSFEGEHIKSLYIHTDDPENERIHLKVSVNVPKLFEIEPQVQKWKVGETAASKKISFKVLYEKPVKIERITSSRENFEAEFKEIKEGREYEISVKPQDTSKPMLGALSVHTDCPIEKHKKKLVFFSISRR